jgi:hypothetical protein
MTYGVGVVGFCCACCAPDPDWPPFLALLVDGSGLEAPSDAPPTLGATAFFEFFLAHAFSGKQERLPRGSLEAARALVALSGDPGQGFQALREQRLLLLPYEHGERGP